MSLELERQTRRERIDPKLAASGWRVVPFLSGKSLAEYGNQAAITEVETAAGPADYALWDQNEALGVTGWRNCWTAARPRSTSLRPRAS